MGLDVTLFAINLSTDKGHIFSQFRNTWWLVDRLNVEDTDNGFDVELTKEQLQAIIDDASTRNEKDGKRVNYVLSKMIEVADWKNERVYVNCWW